MHLYLSFSISANWFDYIIDKIIKKCTIMVWFKVIKKFILNQFMNKISKLVN
jgi:hypothetical protein